MGSSVYKPTILLASALALSSCGTSSPAGASTTTSTITPSKVTTTKAVPTSTTSAFSIVQSPAISGPVVLNGNGIGNAIFGQPEATAIANL